MYIYIDESGTFTTPEKTTSSISCVTALVIPETKQVKIFKIFEAWRKHYAFQGEIKGSKLNEEQMFSLLSAIAPHDLIVETVCTDTGSDISKKDDIMSHKEKLILSMSRNISPEYENISHIEARQNLESLSPQLYIQMILTLHLIKKTLEISMLYYGQRLPQELSEFNWVIDAKNKKITRYETTLSFLIKPILQSMFYKRPAIILKEMDLSHFEKFLLPRENKNSRIMVNLDKLFSDKNISFVSSFNNPGVQLADIFSSCIKRAMSGNLQAKGWTALEKLFIHRKTQTIEIISFSDFFDNTFKPKYYSPVNFIQKRGKPMIILEI